MAPDRTLDIQGSIPTGGTIQPQETTRMVSVGRACELASQATLQADSGRVGRRRGVI